MSYFLQAVVGVVFAFAARDCARLGDATGAGWCGFSAGLWFSTPALALIRRAARR